MNSLTLIVMGGFLGSGKTTAIRQAAASLGKSHLKVAVITNDQGYQQVDAGYMWTNGILTHSLSGGCFCCRYPALEEKLLQLTAQEDLQILFAEAVGSCTDLAATVINPLLRRQPGLFKIVFCVFADIRLLVRYLREETDLFSTSIGYIYGKQLEEAGMLVVTKIDLLPPEALQSARKIIDRAFPDKMLIYLNCLEEAGIERWIGACMQQAGQSLHKTPFIDYSTYGAAEAELAWLDEEIGILASPGGAGTATALLIEKLLSKIKEAAYPIGHIKFLLDDGSRTWKLSITSSADTLDRDPFIVCMSDRLVLLVNARIQTDPESIQKIMAAAILETEAAAGCQIHEYSVHCFKPNFPRPVFRQEYS